jgi:hypothetical protein
VEEQNEDLKPTPKVEDEEIQVHRNSVIWCEQPARREIEERGLGIMAMIEVGAM